MNVIIAGSREFTNSEVMFRTVRRLKEKYADLTIIAGGARGADRMAARIAGLMDVPVREFMADWHNLGKAAGYKRNEVMASVGEMCIIFYANGPKTAGSMHMENEARKKGMPVHVYHEGKWS